MFHSFVLVTCTEERIVEHASSFELVTCTQERIVSGLISLEECKERLPADQADVPRIISLRSELSGSDCCCANVDLGRESLERSE